MRTWIFSVAMTNVATSNAQTTISIRHWPGRIRDETEEQAKQRILAVAYKRFPAADGWTDSDICLELETNLLDK
jgi:hypothetical protein